MTFYFYDLETSSGSPRGGRIMQFAGQRTNENLEPVGEPDNILIKLADDILPEPDAILVHGITPQQTLSDGITEAEFLAYFHEKIAIPDTVFLGFNNIRFDDEFMRYANYRSFYDPYEWHWKDGRGRWDLLDAFRMMRALRPDGMKWPLLDGKPTVKLELLAKENGVTHENAHDALSDVLALIELAQLFLKHQPKLFTYLLNVRDKRAVARLVEADEAFVYTSGKYASEFEKTSVVKSLFRHPRREAAVVYDLRFDPTSWLDKDAKTLAKHWAVKYGDDIERLPVKTIQYNRCPAVAPLSVLDAGSKVRIKYSDDFEKHAKVLADNPGFLEKLKDALDIIEHEQQARLPLGADVDNQLYDGFWNDADRAEMLHIRMSDPADFSDMQKTIKNKRLRELMPLYKARNYAQKLSPEEHEAWDAYRRKALFDGGEKSKLARVMTRLAEIAKTRQLSSNDEYLLSELQLYIESIIPETDA
ncbi:exodeoxyribonuclease I [Candidatus Saccharibacteria bacterium]|nr:exodeoxyribonuclease I [Candidatus Saccharibacteria bacterium]